MAKADGGMATKWARVNSHVGRPSCSVDRKREIQHPSILENSSSGVRRDILCRPQATLFTHWNSKKSLANFKWQIMLFSSDMAQYFLVAAVLYLAIKC